MSLKSILQKISRGLRRLLNRRNQKIEIVDGLSIYRDPNTARPITWNRKLIYLLAQQRGDEPHLRRLAERYNRLSDRIKLEINLFSDIPSPMEDALTKAGFQKVSDAAIQKILAYDNIQRCEMSEESKLAAQTIVKSLEAKDAHRVLLPLFSKYDLVSQQGQQGLLTELVDIVLEKHPDNFTDTSRSQMISLICNFLQTLGAHLSINARLQSVQDAVIQKILAYDNIQRCEMSEESKLAAQTIVKSLEAKDAHRVLLPLFSKYDLVSQQGQQGLLTELVDIVLEKHPDNFTDTSRSQMISLICNFLQTLGAHLSINARLQSVQDAVIQKILAYDNIQRCEMSEESKLAAQTIVKSLEAKDAHRVLLPLFSKYDLVSQQGQQGLLTELVDIVLKKHPDNFTVTSRSQTISLIGSFLQTLDADLSTNAYIQDVFTREAVLIYAVSREPKLAKYFLDMFPKMGLEIEVTL